MESMDSFSFFIIVTLPESHFQTIQPEIYDSASILLGMTLCLRTQTVIIGQNRTR